MNSTVNPEARSVFRLHHTDGDLALKLDLDGAETQRPRQEFETLTRLLPVFTETDARIVEPIWYDPETIGLLTRFVSGPTALHAVTDDPSAENLALLGTNGAQFLNTLHAADLIEEIGYWPEWVLKRLTSLASKTGQRMPQIGTQACNQLIERFRQISHAQRGAACLKTLAHGDFHGGNLIIGEAPTGLDMTEMRYKLGLYDAVDYLTSLEILRPDAKTELTDLGLHPALDQAFVETYSHDLPREVLRCAMLGKWLILTFKITKARHAASSFQRAKLKRLLTRIAHMT